MQVSKNGDLATFTALERFQQLRLLNERTLFTVKQIGRATSDVFCLPRGYQKLASMFNEYSIFIFFFRNEILYTKRNDCWQQQNKKQNLQNIVSFEVRGKNVDKCVRIFVLHPWDIKTINGRIEGNHDAESLLLTN